MDEVSAIDEKADPRIEVRAKKAVKEDRVVDEGITRPRSPKLTGKSPFSNGYWWIMDEDGKGQRRIKQKKRN